jgi:hypothetical protein
MLGNAWESVTTTGARVMAGVWASVLFAAKALEVVGECSIPTSNVLLQAVMKISMEITDKVRVIMVSPPNNNRFIQNCFPLA